ncbi:MlaD family protein [Halorhodospira abdelmalekii]|uniref:MlaD family protein n=1 Tax=Halorhodospira abdelmalekii TaxID=421629 RepID=UPI001905BFC3
METQARHVWIGLLTLLLLIGTLSFGVWLADWKLRGERQAYRVVLTENVLGLSAYSAVKLNGVDVGEVERLELDRRDPRRVVAYIWVDRDVPVTTETRAQLAMTNLLTGSVHIRLVPGDLDAPLLRRQEEGVPQIAATPSAAARLREDMGNLFSEAETLVERINSLLAEENIESMAATLADVQRLVALVVEHDEAIEQGLLAVTNSAQRAEATLTRVESVAEQLEALLEGPGEQALLSTARAAESLAQSSEQVEELFSEHQAAIAAGLHGLQGVEPLLMEMHETLHAVRSFIQRLEQGGGGSLLERERLREHSP